ncbi:hypothetical protein OUZ56_024429 [Daphnia magna]|uniref:Uncharacterized protein n=1 Tax=Daphnia magna TaxID=35525 RepID=A0ABR0B0T8_9CRUS|nr:hypothetical protein OUZ56_024429 [Daphnia magna]
MSAVSVESSASVLRQRALFSSANPLARGNSPFDSRVSISDPDSLSILPSVRNSPQSQRDRNQRTRGDRSVSRSRSRSRSGRSRTRSPSIVRSRSRSPNPAAADGNSFHITRAKSRQVRKWLLQGLPANEAKALRLNFKPEFDGTFELLCPKLDDSMERKWLRSKNLPKLKDYQETMLKSIQYQMLDSIRPMLHAWNQLRTDDPLFNSLESSLRLLGFAFANVSKLRRENVIRHVAPSMKPLLKDPRAFSSREFERLFGSKFIDVMVKEVDDDAKLAKIGRDGGSSSSQSRGNFNRRNGDRNQNSHDDRNNQNGGFSNRGKGGKNDKGSPFFKQPLQGVINKLQYLTF